MEPKNKNLHSKKIGLKEMNVYYNDEEFPKEVQNQRIQVMKHMRVARKLTTVLL